jgi:hypothetical protein
MGALRNSLKTVLFIWKILLDTVLLRLIRFRQKVLMDQSSVGTILP